MSNNNGRLIDLKFITWMLTVDLYYNMLITYQPVDIITPVTKQV